MISGHGNSSPDVMFVSDHAQGEDLKTNYALSGYKEKIIRDRIGKSF